jgi:glycerol-3-phosphate dehydrogenase (NAD(P)+)
MTTITVLGSGIMASALSVPLADNGHTVRLVGTFLDREIIDRIQDDGVHPGLEVELPSSVEAYQLERLADALEGAEVVLSGVNSFGVAWAGDQLAPLLRPGQHVVMIAKGMAAEEDGTLRTLPAVLAAPVPDDVREQVSWTAIVGPSIAGEVAVRRQTCVLFAGEDTGAAERMADLFRTDAYHVWTWGDIVGAEVSAALKNCFALGVGISNGVLETLEDDPAYQNFNFAAAVFAQGAAETRRMVELLGGDDASAHVLPTVGDMYVTSMGGRNVRVGRLMGAGWPFSEAREELGNPTLEGAACIEVVGGALPKLTERGVIAEHEFPLLRHLYEVVGLERPLDVPWDRFFTDGHR